MSQKSPDPVDLRLTTSDIDAVLADLAEQVRNGVAIDIDKWCQRYQEHAAELRQVLPTLQALADFRDVAGQTTSVAPLLHDDRNPLGTLGDFRIVREIGRGGMGVVYEAEQISLNRRVALKVLPFVSVLDNRQLQRFRTEAMAAARLHHPHVVPVFQVGCDRAVHFYAMQYIDGRNIAELIRETRHSAGLVDDAQFTQNQASVAGEQPHVSQRIDQKETVALAGISTNYSSHRLSFHRGIAELGAQAARALDFAHERGILHRDIKPSNLMLDGEGRLWVTDFGLARIEGDSGLTVSGDLLGTLRYMSPEQVLGKRLIIDQRTDIYSLGASLYEMLTLRPAYIGSDRAELLRQISFEHPLALRKVDATIPVDLETIIQTAMAREPHRRYETAGEFADDLQRFLDHKPILAKPPSRTSRIHKWVARNQPQSISLAILAIAALFAAYGVWQLNRVPSHLASSGGQAAAETLNPTESSEVPPFETLGDKSTNPGRASETEGPAPTAAAREQSLPPATVTTTTLPGLIPNPPDLPDLGRWQMITREPLGVIRSAAWSPDEDQLALAEGNLVRIYDAATTELKRVLLAHQRPVNSVAWCPDGTRVASSSDDTTVRIWSDDGRPLFLLQGHAGPVYQVVWRPDGNQLASASADGSVKIWSADGQLIRTLENDDSDSVHENATNRRHVFAVDWSPDGTQLVSVGGDIRPAVNNDAGDNSVQIWNVRDGTLVRAIKSQVAYTGLCVDWQPNGSQIAVGFGHFFRSTSWLGNSLPYAGVRIWNSDGTPIAAVGRDRGSIHAVAWNPDGQAILFGGRAGHIHYWSAESKQVSTMRERHSFDVNAISWNRWGTKALTTSRQFVRSDDPVLDESQQIVSALKHKLSTVKWSPDGTQIAVDGKFFWTAAGAVVAPSDRIQSTVKWWERDSHLEHRDGTPAPPLELDNVEKPIDYNWKFAWSKDDWLAGGNWWDHSVRIWDESGKLRSTLFGHRGGVESVSWSPDGTMLVSGGGDAVRFWHRDGTSIPPVITGHSDEVYPVEWSPDGRWIASGSSDATVRLWRPNGTPGPVMYGHQAGLFALAWSPDSREIASASWLDNTIRVWDIATGQTLWLAIQLTGSNMVAFNRHGELLDSTEDIDSSQLQYVIEQADGSMQALSFNEFHKRLKPRQKPLL